MEWGIVLIVAYGLFRLVRRGKAEVGTTSDSALFPFQTTEPLRGIDRVGASVGKPRAPRLVGSQQVCKPLIFAYYIEKYATKPLGKYSQFLGAIRITGTRSRFTRSCPSVWGQWGWGGSDFGVGILGRIGGLGRLAAAGIEGVTAHSGRVGLRREYRVSVYCADGVAYVETYPDIRAASKAFAGRKLANVEQVKTLALYAPPWKGANPKRPQSLAGGSIVRTLAKECRA